MLRKSLIAGSLALLALGTCRPAAADAKFLEEYGNLFGGRTFLAAPDDTSPKDALKATHQGEGGPTTRFLISPFFRHVDPLPGVDIQQYGGALGYASSAGRTPWSIVLGLGSSNIDIDGIGEDDFFGWDVTGKIQVLSPREGRRGPFVSLVGRYQDVDDVGRRWDLALAADQPLSDELYFTFNIGYADLEFDGGGGDDGILSALGVTYGPSGARWSLSADYTFDNSVEDEDFWTVSALYRASDSIVLRLGGGKHSTLFGNLIWLWGEDDDED